MRGSLTSAPNPRVQRTRSSPSARHEPLTRCPLGGESHVAAGLLLCAVTLAGCSTADGKRHGSFAEQPSPATVWCVPVQQGSGSLIRVNVADDHGRPFPGAGVDIEAADRKYHRGYETSATGSISSRLPPGSWKVGARLVNFRPGTQLVELVEDHACEVTFNLRFTAPETE